MTDEVTMMFCVLILLVLLLQKVVFEMKSDVGDAKYTSIVRSCAENCFNQDDHLDNNCTGFKYTTRGCLKRTCCNDKNFCNVADVTSFPIWNFVVVELTAHCVAAALLL